MQSPIGQSSSPAPARVLSVVKQPLWTQSPANENYYINSVAVSADGSRVIAGTFYHQYGGKVARDPGQAKKTRTTPPPASPPFGTYAYDATGTLLWKDEFSGGEGIYWVAISADGSKAAAGGLATTGSSPGTIRAFDAATGAKLLDVTAGERVNQVVLSRDGTWLASAADSVRLFQYDATSNAYTQTGEYTPPASTSLGSDSNDVVSIGLSADGSTLVYSDYAGHLGVLQNSNGTLSLLQQWSLPSNYAHMVALSPDGQWFAAGGGAGAVYLCQTSQFVTQGTPTYTYASGVQGAVYGVAVEDDGSGFAAVVNAGEAGEVHFVQRNASGGVMCECKFPTQRNPNSVSLNRGAQLMAVADGHPDGTPGNFYLFENITRTLLPPKNRAALRWQCPTGNMSWPIVVSANGNAVVGGSDDSKVYYFTP